jgi:hemoglobin-like flavoprotein
MEEPAFSYWKIIIDHLMTHDKTTFRDFLSRMSVKQSSSLTLFSSKDQENEQRGQLAKRLAFILFCSEKDQYQRYMSEIQEKLIECLRMNSSPVVQSQILLCFRVLLLRMSHHHLTSLWPIIYTEMFQAFLQIECELNSTLSTTAEFK